jgi:hypothetical protein
LSIFFPYFWAISWPSPNAGDFTTNTLTIFLRRPTASMIALALILHR